MIIFGPLMNTIKKVIILAMLVSDSFIHIIILYIYIYDLAVRKGEGGEDLIATSNAQIRERKWHKQVYFSYYDK